jgi:hypothetical protein
LRRALCVAALITFLVAPAAQAHFDTAKLGYRSTIEDVEPRMPGIRMKVLYGDDQIWLENRSGKTIVIDGYGDEPYIKFAPAGIFVNINSPAGFLNQDRYGKATVPKSASPEAAPNWKKLAGGNVWAWHDHRIHFMSPTYPPVISAAPDEPHHVFDWKVPATANGERFVIAGSLDYAPPPNAGGDDSFPFELVIVLAVVIGGGMVGLFFLRRVLVRSLA